MPASGEQIGGRAGTLSRSAERTGEGDHQQQGPGVPRANTSADLPGRAAWHQALAAAERGPEQTMAVIEPGQRRPQIHVRCSPAPGCPACQSFPAAGSDCTRKERLACLATLQLEWPPHDERHLAEEATGEGTARSSTSIARAGGAGRLAVMETGATGHEALRADWHRSFLAFTGMKHGYL